MFKILTHNGRFHMDEIFSIALLRQVFGPLDVERTRDIPTDLKNKLVLDMGLKYEEFKIQKIINEGQIIDHHQSKLPSTALLIHDVLVYQEYLPYIPYLENLLVQISNRDVNGPSNEYFEAADLIQVMTFEQALQFVELWLQRIYASLETIVSCKGYFNDIPVFKIISEGETLPNEAICTLPAYFIQEKFDLTEVKTICIRRGGVDLPDEWRGFFDIIFFKYIAKSRQYIDYTKLNLMPANDEAVYKVKQLITVTSIFTCLRTKLDSYWVLEECKT